MKKPNKIVAGIAGLILPFMSGCASPPLTSVPQSELNPILSQESQQEGFYDEINKKTEIIIESLKKNFPEGLVVYFKEKNPVNDRYIAVKTLNDALNLIIYRCPDPKIKEKLREYYFLDKTPKKTFYSIDAVKILNENYVNKAFFHDIAPYGIRESEQEDFIKTTNTGMEEITIKEGKLIAEGTVHGLDESGEMSRKFNVLYNNYLEKLISE